MPGTLLWVTETKCNAKWHGHVAKWYGGICVAWLPYINFNLDKISFANQCEVDQLPAAEGSLFIHLFWEGEIPVTEY
jgi:hypothetical protein